MSSKLFMDNVGELKEGLDGSRFQKELADFIIKNRFKTIVETGFGVSSVFIVYALKHSFDMQDARLFSVDPKPWYKGELNSPQHELWRSKSEDALKSLYKRTGVWDVFLHDGWHDARGMTYDLEFGYGCLRPNGVIVCDDHSWNNGNVWSKFVERHGLKELRMGDAAYAIKTGCNTVNDSDLFHEHCLAMAIKNEQDWFASGNKNSDCFK